MKFNKKSHKQGSSSRRTDRFSREKDLKDSIAEKGDKSDVTCYNCDKKGQYANVCRNPKKETWKALIPTSQNWLESSDSEDEHNYTLMENTKEPAQTTDKVQDLCYNFDTDNLIEQENLYP